MSRTPDSCPLPKPSGDGEFGAIARMLSAKRIAIVGLSDDPSRPSHEIGEYLLSQGKEIIPVNPTHTQVLGRRCYARLADVPGPIDLVNVFRRPEFCADVTREAIAAGARGVWLQSGITNAEAKKLADDVGIDFVQNRCIMVEHAQRS
ncbi:MAG: CoA-binding protein [Tepidisphaeraceae bacterium]